MLYSQGVRLEELGIPRRTAARSRLIRAQIWRKFAKHYHLFRGTPTRLWLDQAFATCSASTERLSAANADHYYDRIAEAWRTPEFRPRALFERFSIEVIATTESPLDPLEHHERSAIGLEGPRRHRLPAGPGGRSGIRRLSGQLVASARSRAATPFTWQAIWKRTACAAPSSSDTARPRRTTAIDRARQSICRRRTPRRCSPRRDGRCSPRRMRNCSARRC